MTECNKHTISIWYSNEKGINIQGIIQQQLKSPRARGVPDDHILVTDIHRLQKFSFDGHYVKSIGSDKAGPDPLQLNCPRGLAIHPVTGQVFIADSHNNCILVLNADLSFETKGDNKLNDPYDVAFDNEGCIYVADYGNDCIKSFSSDCCYLSQFGSCGSGLGQMWTLTSVTIDTHNLVYVTELNNHRISIFNTSGQFQ